VEEASVRCHAGWGGAATSPSPLVLDGRRAL
jgi:hypothetical protein